MAQRPLAPKTVAQYERILERARAKSHNAPGLIVAEHSFGDVTGSAQVDVKKWPNSQRKLLRAALAYEARANGLDPAPLVRSVPVDYEIKREVKIPGEELARAYEAQAGELPVGYRALALLPLRLGMRASEVCALERSRVQEALKTGELTFVRKGGRERTLPVGKVRALLEEMLAVPPKRPKTTLHALEREQRARHKRTWDRAGEILSCGAPLAQYHAIHKLIAETGKAAGLEESRPHILRHAFATRMNRDGAPLFTIQRALDHASISTTQRYVHPDTADVEKFMR